MDKIKVLFLAADPSDAVRLRLGQELRDIREKLQLSKQRDVFLLDSRESVRPGDITQAIHDVAPQIVHFSGHGTSAGELCFEDLLGKSQPVPPDALANLFELVAEQVSCVVLNACYSEAQAKAIAKHIPFVIGMNQSIGDKAAITFAVGFYKALGAGRVFEDAYKFALVEMQLEGSSENLTPVLYGSKTKDVFAPVERTQTTSKLQTSLPSSKSSASSNNFFLENIGKVILAHSSQIITVEEAIHRFDVSPIIKRFGTWVVTTYGVEGLSAYYPIEIERVYEEDWLDHMRGKTWTNMVDFEEALSYAQDLIQIKQNFSISGNPLKVFLCHSIEDKSVVMQLYYRLIAYGMEIWLDEENLLPGQDRKYEIARAVRESDVVLVCLSRTSVNETGFVQEEIKYALDVTDEKPEGTTLLIPARLEECLIPKRLREKQWVDLFQKQGFERLIKSLQVYVTQQR